MRKLAGNEVEQSEDASVAPLEEKPKVVEGKKWVPYLGELPAATYKDKVRTFKDPNGDLRSIKETVLSKDGAPQYSVVRDPIKGIEDLLEWRKGYGGTQRRLVRTFKTSFPDTPEGNKKKAQQKAFRAMLRSKGIPGA